MSESAQIRPNDRRSAWHEPRYAEGMNPLTFYVGAFAAGGILLALSLLGGGNDATDPSVEGEGAFADSEVDGAEPTQDADAEATNARTAGGFASARLGAALLTALPVFSIQFWTFFLAFGGLAGVALTWLGSTRALVTAAFAVGVGYGAGVGVVLAMRWLRRNQVTSELSYKGLVGASGVVVLPVGPRATGRVRFRLEDRVLDLDAETDGDPSVPIGAEVMVYAVRDDGVALVVAAARAEGRVAKKKGSGS